MNAYQHQQQQQQPQPSPSQVSGAGIASLFNNRWVINGGAALVLALTVWFVMRPDQKQAPAQVQQAAPIQQVQPQVQAPIQAAPIYQAQPTQAAPIYQAQPQVQPAQAAPIYQAAPVQTYQALQVSQPALDPNEARYRELAGLMISDRASFDAITAQYQGWVSNRIPGDATAVGILRLLDENAVQLPYAVAPKPVAPNQ